MKKILCLVLSAVLCMATVCALAEQGVAYGVYSLEGEHPDSLIRAVVDTEGGKITAVDFDEKLIPVAVGGAEGWAELNEENSAKLGDAVVVSGDKTYPAAFAVDGIVWNIDENLAVTNADKGDFMAYVCTPEGGEWYFAQTSADLLDNEGNVAATVAIETKESIEHGVHFWPSEKLFPGNIAALESFVVANGVDYTLDDMAMGADGWTVADAVTGATLAGSPNYLLLAQAAYNAAK